MTAINERRYLGEVIPNYIELEAKNVPASGVNNKYWIITIDEVPGKRPEVSSNILVSTNATFTSLLKQVSNKIPAIGEYAIEGQDIYFNSFYASTTIYFRYNGVGSIVKQQDLDALSAQIAVLAAGSVTPAGSSGDVQFNGVGSLGASPLFNWNDISKRLTMGTGSIIRVIDGAGAGKVLTSDLNGDLTLQAFSGIPAGSDREIQFNNASSFGSSSNLTFTVGNKLVVTGTVQITGGVPALNKVLTSDATGNATWENSVAIAGGVDGDIQFKSGVNFAGNSELNWDDGNKRLTLGSLATLRIITGAGAGKILSSDVNGDASWIANPVFTPGGAYRIPFANSGGTALTDSDVFKTDGSSNFNFTKTTGNIIFTQSVTGAFESEYILSNTVSINSIKTNTSGHLEFKVNGNRVMRVEVGVSEWMLYLDSTDRLGILQPTPTARIHLLAPTSNTDDLIKLSSVDDGDLITVDSSGALKFFNASANYYKLYNNASNQFQVNYNGSDKYSIRNDRIRSLVSGSFDLIQGAGSTTVPVYTFNGGTTDGFSRSATNQLSFITNSLEALQIDASQNVTVTGILDILSGAIWFTGAAQHIASPGDVFTFTNTVSNKNIRFRVKVATTLTDGLVVNGVSGFQELSTDLGSLRVKQYSSQTRDMLTLEGSTGTDLLTVDSDGSIQMTGTNGVFWGDSGLYESAGNLIRVKIGNNDKFWWIGDQYAGVTGGSGTFLNEVSTATNPTYAPHKGSLGSGIGGTVGTVSLITGGVEAVRIDATQALALGGKLCGLTSDVVHDVWDDIVADLSAGKTGVTNPPTFNVVRDNIRAMQFAVGDEMWISFHITHDYAVGTDVFPHVHWQTNSTTPTIGSVRWGFEYTIAKGHDQSNFGATTTVYAEQNVAAVSQQYRHMIAEVATGISSAELEIDSLVMVRVFRAASTGTEFTGNVFGMMADLHANKNRYGSKNKVPNFYT